MAQVGGSATANGILYQILGAIDWAGQIRLRAMRKGDELADQTGLPVFFHMDDIHFWYERTDLHSDPDNVEWSAFPKEGETVQAGDYLLCYGEVAEITSMAQ